MSYPTRYYRLYNFYLDQVLGRAANWAKVDAELSGLQVTVDALNTVVRGITTASGGLTNVASATALSMAGAQRFVATASQTLFNCSSIGWDATFSSASVVVFANGVRIDSGSVAVASDGAGTPKLNVTLSAQAVGTVIIVNAYAPYQTSLPAASVTVADAAGYYAATNAEDALAEVQNSATYGIRTLVALLPGGTLAGLASYLKKDGTVTMTGSLNMGGGTGGGYVSANGQKVVGLKGGSANGDAVEWSQFTAFTTVWNTLTNYFLKLDGTAPMAGALAMGSNKITGMAAGTTNGDGIRYDEFIAQAASNIASGILAVARLPPMVGASSSVAGTAGIVPVPAAGDQLKVLRGDGTWAASASALGSGFIILEDQKATTTPGQTFVTGTWNQRNITTEVVDTNGQCTVGSNQFTLDAGTYRLSASAPAYKADRHRLRLYNVTAAAVTAYGPAAYTESTVSGGVALINCRFTIAATTTFRLDHWSGNGVVSGGGVETSDGTTEIYTHIEIVRE